MILKDKKRLAHQTLEWCIKKFGTPLKNKYPRLDLVNKTGSKNTDRGDYGDRIIRIFLNNCNTKKCIINTIIHEYTHFLQMPRLNSVGKYYKMEDRHGYRNNPYEIEANENADKHTSACYQSIYRKNRKNGKTPKKPCIKVNKTSDIKRALSIGVFNWCVDKFGSPLKNILPELKLVNKRGYDNISTHIIGEYGNRVITVYLNRCLDKKMLISTIIHQYTYFLQMPRINSIGKYYKMLSKYGNDNHPMIIRANENADKYTSACYQSLRLKSIQQC
jgi:hypothetical protein